MITNHSKLQRRLGWFLPWSLRDVNFSFFYFENLLDTEFLQHLRIFIILDCVNILGTELHHWGLISHVSHVTCHVSHVTCHVSHVIFFYIYIFFTIPPKKNILVLWSASVERFIVSRMRDFYTACCTFIISHCMQSKLPELVSRWWWQNVPWCNTRKIYRKSAGFITAA